MRYFFFGHHRCGTTWIRDIICELCVLIGSNYFVYGGTDSNFKNDDLNQKEFHCYINAILEDTMMMKLSEKGFHVIRDPRDCLISDYFSRKYSHSISNPKQQKLRDDLLNLPFEQGLIRMLEFQKQYGYLKQIKGWTLEFNSNILDVKYEDMLNNQIKYFFDIVKFLGLQIENAQLEKIVENNSFQARTNRKPGNENIMSHRRKAVAGDWKNYFYEDSHLRRAIYRELGEIIVALGYRL